MVQYVQNIIIPYVTSTWGAFEENTPALVVMDNFKGQITTAITDLLEGGKHPHLPPSTQHNQRSPTNEFSG